MSQMQVQPDDPIGPLDWRKAIPFQAVEASDRLGWVGLEAARYRAAPAFELNPPAITHHRLVFFSRPPEELDLRFEGVKRHVPPPAGAIMLVPAGIKEIDPAGGGLCRFTPSYTRSSSFGGRVTRMSLCWVMAAG